MLVLGRKINERILIGNEIEVVLVGIRGKEARIGINAPRALPVVRGELPRFNLSEADLPLADPEVPPR